jgi:hypothetical protein
VSFTVPASGNVRAQVSVFGDVGDTEEGTGMWLAFATHGTTTAVTPKETVIGTITGADTTLANFGRVVYDSGLVTGLTPGATVQWDVIAAASASTSSGLFGWDDGKTGSNTNGPIVITVYDPAGTGGGGGGGGLTSFQGRTTAAAILESSDVFGLFGAAGQILMGTGSGTGEFLTPGTSGYVLTSNGPGEALSWTTAGGGGGDYLPVFNVRDYGATGNGTTDDTSAIESALAAASAAGGGWVWFPPGVYLVTSTINLPVTSTVSTAPGNPPETNIYLSTPIRMFGNGGNQMPRGDAPTFGAIIKLDFAADGTFINGLGEGQFEFDHLAIVDDSASDISNLFFFFTNTVTNIHDNHFRGNNAFTSAATDVVRYGAIGGTEPTDDVNGIYQGQVSSLTFNYCTQIRHLASLYADASCIRVAHNAMANTCGTNLASDAPIVVVGPGAVGNWFEYNDLEMGTFTFVGDEVVRSPIGYAYGILFNSGYLCHSIGNNFGDAYVSGTGEYPSALACHYFSAVTYSSGYPVSGSYGNIVSLAPGDPNSSIYIPWAAGEAIANICIANMIQDIAGGAGGVVTGPVLEAGDGLFFVQEGVATVTTGTNGQAAITFPTPFPNGVQTVFCQSNGVHNVADSSISFVGQVFDITTSGFVFYLQNTFESSGDREVTVMWRARGF